MQLLDELIQLRSQTEVEMTAQTVDYCYNTNITVMDILLKYQYNCNGHSTKIPI